MKRLEAILSRDSLESVTGLLIEHGCGRISLSKVDGLCASQPALESPAGHGAEFPWIRLEAVVADAEAFPAVQAILRISHRPAEQAEEGNEPTERISSIAIWKLEGQPGAGA